MIGTLQRHAGFQSAFVESRNVDVWLPPGYSAGHGRRFPVIYMHDGQNLFDPQLAFGGVDWGVDEAITDMMEAGEIVGAIVIGIWNIGEGRWLEYMPQRALTSPSALEAFRQLVGSEPLSDRYLRFLVQEIKPFMDKTYRTSPRREGTFVVGSSMGALISLYALCEYPHVFKGAGCLSTHWSAGDGIVIEYLDHALPPPGTHRLYFDYGTETLDAEYEPYQRQIDAVMRSAGYQEGVDWITRKFPGAEHSERSWHRRVHVPLRFLLGGTQLE